MAKTISSLSVVLGATVAPLVNAFRSAGQATESLQSSVASTAGGLLKLTGVAGIVAGSLAAIRGVFGSLTDSISLASTLEQNQVAFETMLGSADTAKAMLQQLQAFAAQTPFEFPEIAKAAKSLLAFGVTAGDIPSMLQHIGDVAAGVGQPFGELAEIIGKIKTGGVQAEDINSLAGRGIPIIRELAKILGVAESQVKGLVSEGKVGFPQIDQAFRNMTGTGGQFAGMMEKQSTTLGGLWSTLTDNISMSMAGMITKIIDAFHLKGAIAALIGFTGTAGDYLQDLVGRIAPIVMSVGGRIAGFVGGMLSDMYAVAAPVVTGLYNFLAGASSGMYATAVQAFTGVYNAVVTVLSSVWSFVSPIVAGIVNVVSQSWLSVVSTAIGYANALFNVWSGVYVAAWQIVQSAAQGIATVWTWAMDLLGLSTMNAKGVTEGALGGIVSAVQWLYETVTLALNVVAFGLRNFQDVIAAAMLASAYQVVRFANQVTYFFADVIPGYLAWFGRNWQQIFTDAANFTATVFSNMGANVGNFFAALWGAIKGDGFNFQWTGLTEGFKATLSELPQIAERQVGPLEKSLGDAADALTNDLSKGLGQYLAEQNAKTKAAADAVKGTVNGIGKSIGDAFARAGSGTIDDMANDVAGMFQNAPSLDVNNAPALAALGQVKAAASDLKTVFAGSAEAAQLQAQAVFAAQAAPPAAKAVQPSDKVNQIAARGKGDDSWLTKETGKQLFAGLLTAMQQTATNTAKPQVAQGSGL